nr:hypothetical protein [Enterococcus sp.]
MTKSNLYTKKEELTLSREQVIENARKQFEFLKVVHPFSSGDGYKEGTIEVKRLGRDFMLKTRPFRSYNTWSFSEKDLELYIEKALENNGLSACVYYSCYTYDNKMINPKTNKSFGQIVNDNALYTTVLLMDFDEITEEEFLNQKARFSEIGIETYDIFSGHGYQSLILLKQKNYDKELFGKFTALLKSKDFKVDKSIVDPARVARMPYSFNCKCYLDVDGEEAPFSYIYNKTDKRYDVDDVFERISKINNPLTKNDLDAHLDELFGKFRSEIEKENTSFGNSTETEIETKTNLNVSVEEKHVVEVQDMFDYLVNNRDEIVQEPLNAKDFISNDLIMLQKETIEESEDEIIKKELPKEYRKNNTDNPNIQVLSIDSLASMYPALKNV